MSKRKQQQLEAMLSPFSERTSTKVGSACGGVVIACLSFSLYFFEKSNNATAPWLFLIMIYACVRTMMALERTFFWQLQLSPQQVDLRVSRLLPLVWQIPWGDVSSARVETRKEVRSSFSRYGTVSSSSQNKCRLALVLQDGRAVRSCWLLLPAEEVKRMGEALALCQSSAQKKGETVPSLRSIHWGFVGVRLAVIACWIVGLVL